MDDFLDDHELQEKIIFPDADTAPLGKIPILEYLKFFTDGIAQANKIIPDDI